jgi:hypothetical protein
VVFVLHKIYERNWLQWLVYCLRSVYEEDEAVVQDNILLTTWSKYSEFVHTVCMGPRMI